MSASQAERRGFDPRLPLTKKASHKNAFLFQSAHPQAGKPWLRKGLNATQLMLLMYSPHGSWNSDLERLAYTGHRKSVNRRWRKIFVCLIALSHIYKKKYLL